MTHLEHTLTHKFYCSKDKFAEVKCVQSFSSFWLALKKQQQQQKKKKKHIWPFNENTTSFILHPQCLKVRDQITFLTPPIYLKVEILVPIDGSYFSHSHPEIWRSKIRYLRRSNQKRVELLAKCGYHTQQNNK